MTLSTFLNSWKVGQKYTPERYSSNIRNRQKFISISPSAVRACSFFLHYVNGGQVHSADHRLFKKYRTYFVQIDFLRCLLSKENPDYAAYHEENVISSLSYKLQFLKFPNHLRQSLENHCKSPARSTTNFLATLFNKVEKISIISSAGALSNYLGITGQMVDALNSTFNTR